MRQDGQFPVASSQFPVLRRLKPALGNW